MNTKWIKRTERKPTRDEFPVFAGRYDVRDGQWIETTWYKEIANIWEYTHWRSIKCAPPARELTQRERDEAAANAASDEAYRLDADKPEAVPVSSARRAIYAERREFKALLSQWFKGEDWGQGETAPPVAKQLRARCDEQGQGK